MFILFIFLLMGITSLISYISLNNEFILGAILAGVMFFVGIFVMFNMPNQYVEYESNYTEIYSLNDSLNVSGGGGLFYTFIDTNLDYNIRVKTEYGYKVVTLDQEHAYLNEDDGQPRYVEIREKNIKNVWFWGEFDTLVAYKIYIPKGSIINEFESDME